MFTKNYLLKKTFHSRRVFQSNQKNQMDSLIKAIVNNDISQMANLLNTMTSPIDWKSADRITPLHLAASLGHDYLLQMMLETDLFNVNCRGIGLVTALHRACKNNHANCVKLLMVQYGADINARTQHHLTPLHICAIVGALECARMIIPHVANINVTDLFGATALHYAVYNKQLELTKLLLKNGAQEDVQDKFGRKPVHYAAMIEDPVILETLVEMANVDINARNKYFVTPLHLTVASSNVQTFQKLLQLNANIDAQDIYGNNISHWIAYIGHIEIYKIASEKIKMNTPNLNGMTALHCACSSANSWNLLQLLIDQYESNLDVVDKFNRTPLHYAAMTGRDKVVNLLISRGSNCNAMDYSLESPMHKAIYNGHRNVIEVLIKHPININAVNKDGLTPLHLAAMDSNAQLCKLLINSGANPLLWDNYGRNAHFMAVYQGSIECFLELMSSPIYLDMINSQSSSLTLFNTLDRYKRSLLHYAAASRCSEEFMKILLLQQNFNYFESLDKQLVEELKLTMKKFDLNQQDIFGRTPLHYLCARENEIDVDIVCLVQLFVECGANCLVVDSFNRLPLHYAIANDYMSLLYHLFDPKWFENENSRKLLSSVISPLKIAVFYGHYLTMDLLIKYGFNDFNGALEIAVCRHKWNCAYRLVPLVKTKSILLKMAYFTAQNGLVDGLRLFLNLPMFTLEPVLFLAASSKDGIGCVELLLSEGVSIQARDNMGRNALFYAVTGCNHSIITLLFQSGIKFVKDCNNRNVFHIIAYHGQLETFILLCDLIKNCGQYENLYNYLISKDNENHSPLEIAILRKQKPILDYYINQIDSDHLKTLMFFSCQNGYREFIESVLAKNGENFLRLSGREGRTLIHYCCLCEHKDLSMLKLLIKFQFDVNETDERNRTPLLYAARIGNFDLVEYLLNNSMVNKVAIDNEQNNVLHMACKSGSNRTALLIIEYAKQKQILNQLMRQKNNFKQTCLHFAAKLSMAPVIYQLLMSGASVNDEDKYGYSASLYCAANKLQAYCLAIIESFIQYPDDVPSISTDLNEESKLSGTNQESSSEVIKEQPTSSPLVVNGEVSILEKSTIQEKRFRRLSSINGLCDNFVQLSLNLTNNSWDSPENISKQPSSSIINNKTNINDNSVTIDSDSDLF